jgi:hypothetical protein
VESEVIAVWSQGKNFGAAQRGKVDRLVGVQSTWNNLSILTTLS